MKLGLSLEGETRSGSSSKSTVWKNGDRMRKQILLILTILLFFFCFLYGFQKQQKHLPPEKHDVLVRLVMVDVIVTKDGKFVTDLAEDDFEIYEDKVKVPINSVELISFMEKRTAIIREKPKEEISPVTLSKKLIVIFDEINSFSRHLKRGAKKIIDELVSLVKQGNEVMVISLNNRKGVEIFQPFTSDEKLIQFAVGKAVGSIWEGKSLDALTMAKDLGIESAGDQAKVERKLGMPQVEETLWDEYRLSEKQKFEISVGGILAVFNTIKDIAGRKSILLVSDGLPELPCRPSDNPWSLRIFDPFDILKKKRNMCAPEVIQELTNYANAQNISIYTLDPGTFSEYFFTASAEPPEDILIRKARGQKKIAKVQNLSWLSKDTGAVSLRGAKKYDKFKQVMSTDLNHYYQLSYYPPRKIADNKYHVIKVKVKRRGVNVRSRKGYTDYSEEEERKILLLSAFYSPELYKKLPFEAEFIPFHENSNIFKPWMSIVLPVKKLLEEGGITYDSQKLDLHIWVMDKKKGESTYQGQINIPLNIDSSFIELMEIINSFCFHFTGPEIKFSQKDYHVIFALYDNQTQEISTWESSFSLPDFNENKQGAIINFVLGSLAPNPDGRDKSFYLSKKGGSLECGEMKFFPAVTNQFQNMQDVSVFLQAYIPQGKISVRPEFKLIREECVLQIIPGEIIAEYWNEKSNVWSSTFRLDLSSVPPGDYTLQVNLLSDKGPTLSKDVRLIK